MSGPKGISYEVVSPEERERRLVATRKQQLNAALSQLHGLQSALSSNAQVNPIHFSTEDADSNELQTMIDEAVQEIASVRSQLDQQAREIAKQAVHNFVPSNVSFDFEPQQREQQSSETEETSAKNVSFESQVARFSARLTRIRTKIAVLNDNVTMKAKRLCDAVAEDLTAGTLTETARRMDELSVEVQRSIRADHLLRAVHEKADSLIVEYADVLTDEIELELRDAATFEQLDTIVDALQRARDEFNKRQDELFVQETTEQILSDLGYRVGRSSPGVLFASSNEWPSYGIKVDASNPGMISTAPLATGETVASDDVAFEKSSCKDILALVKQLNEKGIRTRMRTFTPAGAQPIERVQGKSRQREHRRDKEKSL